MPVINQDFIGLYIHSGGYIARPFYGNTGFSLGEKPKAKHFGDSCLHGVGKLVGRGKYKETWLGCGYGDMEDSIKAATYLWYLNHGDSQIHFDPKVKNFAATFKKKHNALLQDAYAKDPFLGKNLYV